MFHSFKNYDEIFVGRDPIGKLIEQRMVIYNTPQELSFPELHESILAALRYAFELCDDIILRNSSDH